MGMFIYSRVSTERQETENQLSKMREKYPAAQVVEETQSGVKSRPKLRLLIEETLKPGDTLLVAELSRLGRRMVEVVQTIEDLHKRGISVQSEREQINYSTPAGRMMAQVLASVAELEREMLRTRTIEALAAKRKQGIVGGRRPKFTQETITTVREMKARGASVAEIVAVTGVSPSRVYAFTHTRTAEGPRQPRQKYSSEILTRAKELRAQGLSVREIANQIGMSPSRVQQITKAA